MTTRNHRRKKKGARAQARSQPPPAATKAGITSGLPPALDYALSLLVALQTGAVWGLCYDNAYHAFLGLPRLFYPRGTFIEGWIVFEDAGRIALMEHGWLVRDTRSIIDPSIVLVTEPGQPVDYFPGVSRSWAEAEALENHLFPHVRFSGFGADGMGHTGYKAAYRAALRRARALATCGKELVEVRASEVSQEDASRQPTADDFQVRMYLLVPPGDAGPRDEEAPDEAEQKRLHPCVPKEGRHGWQYTHLWRTARRCDHRKAARFERKDEETNDSSTPNGPGSIAGQM